VTPRERAEALFTIEPGDRTGVWVREPGAAEAWWFFRDDAAARAHVRALAAPIAAAIEAAARDATEAAAAVCDAEAAMWRATAAQHADAGHRIEAREDNALADAVARVAAAIRAGSTGGEHGR